MPSIISWPLFAKVQGDEGVQRRPQLGIAAGEHEQRAGDGVNARGDGAAGGLNIIYLQGLDRAVDESLDRRSRWLALVLCTRARIWPLLAAVSVSPETRCFSP